jgi:hypothetical protein
MGRDPGAEVGADDEPDQGESRENQTAAEASERRYDHDRDRNPIDEVERHRASVIVGPVVRSPGYTGSALGA